MRKALLFLTFTGICLVLQAQNIRYWSDQPLRQDEFTGTQAGIPFQISYDLVYARKVRLIDRTRHFHYEARAVMIPSGSWISDDSLKALRLRYGNVIFDLAEIYARRLSDELNVTQSMENSRAQSLRALNDAVGAIASDTKMGTDRRRIEFWERHTDSLLSVTYRKDIPSWRYGPLTIGYSWGPAYHHFTDGLGRQFSSPLTVSNGVFVSWKRVFYSAQVSFAGISRTEASYYYSPTQQFGDTARFMPICNVYSVGYEIVKKPQFVLTPFAGMSTLRIILRDQDPQEIPKTYGNPLRAAFNAGLAMDFRSRPFLQSNHIQLRYGLSIRASYSYYDYLPKISGNCLSFKLGFCIYMDAIKNYL